VGECPDGCADVAIDLVAADDVDAHAARAVALRDRVSALRAVVEHLADGAVADEEARRALAVSTPAKPPDPEIVPAWGCPDCGRLEAPQPCLDVCIRRPVLMADASEYRSLAAETADLEADERRLSRLVRVAAFSHPRPGQEQRHGDELRSHALNLLRD
jgi:hypothetical protein